MGRVKLYQVGFIILVSLMVWGCKKDSPKSPVVCSVSEEESDCFDYVFEGGEVFDTYITTGVQYTKPFFNPNNADEFVYVSSENGYRKLIKHTISSGQEFVLCEGEPITSQPKWGATGWILFTRVFNKVCKIHESGGQVEQLTPEGYESNISSINLSGNYYYATFSPSPLSIGYSPIFNLNGVIEDSIRNKFGEVFIGNPNCLDESFRNGFYTFADHSTSVIPFLTGICKLNNNETIDILNTVDLPGGVGLMEAMCKNSQYIYYVQYGKGLYRLNISTHQVDKLQDNCQSKTIQTLSMSPDGTKILFERVRGKQTTPGGMVIDEQSEIFMYDVNTGEETKILWEE